MNSGACKFSDISLHSQPFRSSTWEFRMEILWASCWVRRGGRWHRPERAERCGAASGSWLRTVLGGPQGGTIPGGGQWSNLPSTWLPLRGIFIVLIIPAILLEYLAMGLRDIGMGDFVIDVVHNTKHGILIVDMGLFAVAMLTIAGKTLIRICRQ